MCMVRRLTAVNNFSYKNKMTVLTEGTVLIVNFWLLINILMGVVRGKKPNCIGDKSGLTRKIIHTICEFSGLKNNIITFCLHLVDDELFSEEHYEEIGFVRDTCVEVARNLHEALEMLKATEPCTSLANTRTSTLWPFCKWNKWTRIGNQKVSSQVMDKALVMMKDFNENPIYKTHKIRIDDQESLMRCIDTAVTRLIKSGAANQDSDITKETNDLKITYCQDYIDYLEQEKQKAEAMKVALLAEAQKSQQNATRRDTQKTENEEEDLNPNCEYPLHESVFIDNPTRLSRLLHSGYNVNVKDKHANTPLHLAAMLGRRSCIDVLLHFEPSTRSRNLAGWTPMNEAVSFGDRNIIRLLWKRNRQQLRDEMVEKRDLLLSQLNEVNDFYMELRWALTTSVPLLTRFGILPSDLCRVYKQGESVRIDSTFFGYKNLQGRRRDTTILIDGSDSKEPSMYFIDHEDQKYESINNNPIRFEGEYVVRTADRKMCRDIGFFYIPTDNLTFTRAKSGWLFFQGDKSEKVGSFMTNFYTIHGLNLVSRKRREHLSNEQIKKNEAASIVNILASGYVPMKFTRKKFDLHDSLPPPHCDVTWEQYINSKPGEYPILGRPMVIKEDIIPYQSEIGMTEDIIPISIEFLMNILEIVTPFKEFNLLRELIKVHMPPGFPVKFKIPLMLTISAEYEIQKFEFSKHDENLFKLPPDYMCKLNKNG